VIEVACGGVEAIKSFSIGIVNSTAYKQVMLIDKNDDAAAGLSQNFF
jgi:hypothetical protein